MAVAGVPEIEGCVDLVRISRGGFSVIYRARQVTLDRQVAVKVLLTDLTDPDDIRRFMTECQILGRLGAHRHVVDVYDARVSPDGQPYIIMKLYSRGSLADRVRREGPLPVREVAEIGAKLAAALQAAHFIGVIHRDVKPDNVLIDDDGEPVLTDFGVASVANAAGEHTTSVAFSRAHAAPEVLTRNQFGVASDVYSLGSTLYTLLKGGNAFPADTEANQINAIITEPPPPITRPDMSPALMMAIQTAMAKNPKDRFASAGAFGKALASIAAQERAGKGSRTSSEIPVAATQIIRRPAGPVPVSPTSPTVSMPSTPQPPASDRRRPWLIAGLVAAAVLLVAALGGGAMFALRGSVNPLGGEAGSPSASLPGSSSAQSPSSSAPGTPSTTPAVVNSVTPTPDPPPTPTPSAPAPTATGFGLLKAGSTWQGKLISNPYGTNNNQDVLDAYILFTDVTNSGFAEAIVEWRSANPQSTAFAKYKVHGAVTGDAVTLKGYQWIGKSNSKFTLDSYDLTLNGASLDGTYRGATYNPNDITKRGDAGTASFNYYG